MAASFADAEYVRLIQEMDEIRYAKEKINKAELALYARPIYVAWNKVPLGDRARILASARSGGGRIKRSRATRKHRKSKRRARQ